MSLCCQQDDRRDAVRRMKGWNGLDYVEVDDDQKTLRVYFLGKLPPELLEDKTGIERFLRIEGGTRITNIRILDADPEVDPDPEKDDFLHLELENYGDHSTYTLRLVGVANVDPHYDHLDFSFKINCPSDLDCAPACACEPERFDEPDLDYLAKDYASFRQLIFDRLALLVPEWKERHVPDLGVALVELLAYVGDYLSYYQDAVATEAYLETARQRISVRRHARLVDYFLHEGCNARAWVHLDLKGSSFLELDPGEMTFITGLNDAIAAKPGVLNWNDLRDVPRAAYQIFEPLLGGKAPVRLHSAHNKIHFHTRGQRHCCLERGSTSATLLDPGVAEEGCGPRKRSLQLKRGDVLIFEEITGPKTGSDHDADPSRRQAVRLTRVTEGVDLAIKTGGEPTLYLEVEWAPEDALLFPFCISAIGPAPDCKYLENISVARGNVILVDHGHKQPPEDLGEVPTLSTDAICECAGEPGDIQHIPGKFRAHLDRIPLTFRQALPSDSPKWTPAAAFLDQDVHAAAPEVWLTSKPAASWRTRPDFMTSAQLDADFVVEIDNDGVAHLRFGDGELGWRPPAGMSFRARYRIGNGTAGNVGADSISRLVLEKTTLDGASVTVRNPLPARGGKEPEPIAEAKLMAPHRFRNPIERAIIAADYEQIAKRNAKVQRASGELAWTGSWYEADVAIDPFGREDPGEALLKEIEGGLYPFRRIGHDLHIERARYVPLDLKLEVCALPHYQRGHIRAALLEVFSNRILAGGRTGFFHPDNLTFGGGIYLSKLVAAGQKVPGVECVKVARLQRLFEKANREIEFGVLPLSNHEIAQLDNDPNHPEHGQLEIVVRGGI